jgi:hypothetical protein
MATLASEDHRINQRSHHRDNIHSLFQPTLHYCQNSRNQFKPRFVPNHSLLHTPSSFSQTQTHTLQVIVGAHYDSTGGSSTARGPGADDNGSGVVTILEALRVIAASGFKPKNTIEFHFYAGEEGGLLGSGAIFSNYASTGKTVLAVVCQGMFILLPSFQAHDWI